jgi:hypothetical protein
MQKSLSITISVSTNFPLEKFHLEELGNYMVYSSCPAQKSIFFPNIDLKSTKRKSRKPTPEVKRERVAELSCTVATIIIASLSNLNLGKYIVALRCLAPGTSKKKSTEC